jgi:hypothetical protein
LTSILILSIFGVLAAPAEQIDLPVGGVPRAPAAGRSASFAGVPRTPKSTKSRPILKSVTILIHDRSALLLNKGVAGKFAYRRQITYRRSDVEVQQKSQHLNLNQCQEQPSASLSTLNLASEDPYGTVAWARALGQLYNASTVCSRALGFFGSAPNLLTRLLALICAQDSFQFVLGPPPPPGGPGGGSGWPLSLGSRGSWAASGPGPAGLIYILVCSWPEQSCFFISFFFPQVLPPPDPPSQPYSGDPRPPDPPGWGLPPLTPPGWGTTNNAFMFFLMAKRQPRKCSYVIPWSSGGLPKAAADPLFRGSPGDAPNGRPRSW